MLLRGLSKCSLQWLLDNNRMKITQKTYNHKAWKSDLIWIFMKQNYVDDVNYHWKLMWEKDILFVSQNYIWWFIFSEKTGMHKNQIKSLNNMLTWKSSSILINQIIDWGIQTICLAVFLIRFA